ncbi:MAG: TaqI-like C-terminal specificity domain-containing protein [Chroococcales cyanobacterium]
MIKPYLRGQDIKRWYPNWQNLWMILTSTDIDINNYPSVREHLEKYKKRLESRSGKQLWWQLQAKPSYHNLLEEPKIIWQDLTWSSKFCFDTNGLAINDLCFTLISSDSWLLAVLNSPLIWSWLWRNTVHGKDEATIYHISNQNGILL